jgi:hypothetical protein
MSSVISFVMQAHACTLIRELQDLTGKPEQLHDFL